MKRFSGFVDKAKSKLGGSSTFPGQAQQTQAQGEQPPSIRAPSYADVQRYRYQHGTNIGTVFILEKWLCGRMFPEGSSGSSELAAVQAWIEREGIDATQKRFESHWQTYVSHADLDWLQGTAKANCIRLPIGYFTLGPPYCQGTPFESVAQVYSNAWSAVKQLVDRCQQRGIGTLIDLHGLPGGANAQEHSGTNSGKCEFWSKSKHRDLGTRCLCFIAQQVKELPGVIGVQVVNESEHNASKMYDWYGSLLDELASIDPTMPVYISDAWDMSKAATWCGSKNGLNTTSNPVVIDSHLYWCFSDSDKRPPQRITQEVSGKFSGLDGKEGNVCERGAAQVIIGEYSCVLAEESWSQSGGTSKDQLVREFGNDQCQTYQQRAGGSFFWTYRMDWMNGGEWGFKQMVDAGAILPTKALTLSKDDVQNALSSAQAQRDSTKQQTVSSHVGYWDSNHPGTYEHWRFEAGWDLGYDDALAFFQMRSQQGFDGADTIGMLDLWCLKRIRESGQSGKFLWEFEQGLRQGIRDARQVLGV